MEIYSLVHLLKKKNSLIESKHRNNTRLMTINVGIFFSIRIAVCKVTFDNGRITITKTSPQTTKKINICSDYLLALVI